MVREDLAQDAIHLLERIPRWAFGNFPLAGFADCIAVV